MCTDENSKEDQSTVASKENQPTVASKEEMIIDGKYKVINQIGEGGMGKVYRVKHSLSNNKIFALKVLHSHLSQNTKFQKRFIREIEAAMAFVHPNAIQIRDVGQDKDGSLYFTMDYHKGVSLHEIIKEEKLEWSCILEIMIQTLEAVIKAHEKGVIHRDLKPENLFIKGNLANPQVVIFDFGIAKILDDVKRTNITGKSILGTPHYMSPEQAQSQKVDKRSDIYSLGAMMYEMVTGKTLFLGSTFQVIKGHINEIPKNPGEIVEIPYSIEKIILTAIEKSPKKRFQSAQEFQNALIRATGRNVAKKPQRKWHSKFLLLMLITILVLIVLMFVLEYF